MYKIYLFLTRNCNFSIYFFFSETYLFLGHHASEFIEEENEISEMVAVPNRQVHQSHQMGAKLAVQPAQTTENVTENKNFQICFKITELQETGS